MVDSTFVMPLDGPWRRVASVDATAWQPHYPGADRAVLYESTTAGEPMFLYANLFLSQSQSKKVVSDENSVLPEAGWQIVSTRLVGDTIELLATDSLNTQWLVHYTYVAGYSVSANGRRSQLSYAWQQFWSDPAAGVVALAIRCQARCINESGVADRVWVQNAALLIRQIQAAGI